MASGILSAHGVFSLHRCGSRVIISSTSPRRALVDAGLPPPADFLPKSAHFHTMTAVSFPFRNSDFAFASAKALHHGAVNCETSETVCSPDGAFDLGDIDLPMGDIDLGGDWNCRDWLKFPVDAVTLLESFGSNNYINADLRKAA